MSKQSIAKVGFIIAAGASFLLSIYLWFDGSKDSDHTSGRRSHVNSPRPKIQNALSLVVKSLRTDGRKIAMALSRSLVRVRVQSRCRLTSSGLR